MKITRKQTARHELEKRCHLPFVVESECKCGAVTEIDLEKDHLSYPVVGEPSRLYFCCPSCGLEWIEEVVLDVLLVPAQETKWRRGE